MRYTNSQMHIIYFGQTKILGAKGGKK